MTDPASERLDDIDQTILDQVRAMHGRLDPPPADLDDRVRFAIALDHLDVEVARRSEDLLVGSGARGTERTRTITFDCASRTIMVTAVDLAPGGVRVDGWLAPAGRLRIELRSVDGSAHEPVSAVFTISDDTGRFVFDGVEHGLVQIVVHPLDDGDATRVVTPSLLL
jgi:hypothetical protein